MTTGAELLDKVKAIKGTGSDEDASVEKGRAMIAGGCVGLMMGIYYGFSKKKNIAVCSLIGAAVGAAVTRLLMPK